MTYCRGKKCYGRKQAEEICTLRNITKGRAGATYLCDTCDYWHLAKYSDKKDYEADKEYSKMWREKYIRKSAPLPGAE